MARAAIDKDELRHDAIQDWMFAAIGYVHRRRKLFSGIAGVVLAIVVGIFGYALYARSQAEQAAAAYNAAEALYRNPAVAADERLPEAEAAFREFVEDYSGSSLAPYGWMYLAAIALERGQDEDAAAAYRAVIDRSDADAGLRSMARIGLAKLRESGGDLEASAQLYRAVTDETYGDAAALGLSRVALAQNDPETARSHLESLTEKHPDSPLAPLAQQTLFFLE